jgi:bifunctional DNase/RNase
MVPVEVHGVGVLAPDVAPVLLLREVPGPHRWLVITVGVPEAWALTAAQEHLMTARPGTIELLSELINAFEAEVAQAEVTDLHHGIFHADLVFTDGLRVSSRPSDAIALALWVHAPVAVASAVLDEAAVEIVVDEAHDSRSAIREQEQKVEEFRFELDELNPDDFREPGQGQ